MERTKATISPVSWPFVFLRWCICVRGDDCHGRHRRRPERPSPSGARVELRRAAPSTGAAARRSPSSARRPNRDLIGPPRDRSSISKRRRAAPSSRARRPRAVMDQRNETFVPHVLAITTGTTVDFPNSDRIYHNVFSLSKAARFDLGPLRAPAARSRSASIGRASCACSATSTRT